MLNYVGLFHFTCALHTPASHLMVCWLRRARVKWTCTTIAIFVDSKGYIFDGHSSFHPHRLYNFPPLDYHHICLGADQAIVYLQVVYDHLKEAPPYSLVLHGNGSLVVPQLSRLKKMVRIYAKRIPYNTLFTATSGYCGQHTSSHCNVQKSQRSTTTSVSHTSCSIQSVYYMDQAAKKL